MSSPEQTNNKICNTSESASACTVHGDSTGHHRLLSLDVFRGIAILLMLIVNNIGRHTTVTQLRHAGWAPTVHLADLAFPWFLLIVGITLPFSVASFKKKALPLWRYDLHAICRSIILFALGCLLLSLDKGRLIIGIGVLQLIAIDYVLAVFFYALPAYRRLILSVLLLVAYWAAIKFIPVPNIGVGVFEDGRNLIDHVNRTYLAPIGMWGLPVVIPTLAMVLLGTLIGDLLRSENIHRSEKIRWLTISGVASIALSLLWSTNLVYNKPLWTSPFILFTVGAGAVLLGILYYVIDYKGLHAWAFPLAVFGSNAIVAYVLPIFCKITIIRPLLLTTRGWLNTMIYIAFWWLVCWLLYRKHWFIRV